MSQTKKLTDAEFSEIKMLQGKFQESIFKMGNQQVQKMERGDNRASIGRAVITATSPIGRRSAEPAVQIRCLWGCADFCPPVIIGNCVHPRFAASKIPTVDCRCDAGHRHWLLLCRKLSRSKLVGKPAGTLGVGRNQFPLRAVLFAALTK